MSASKDRSECVIVAVRCRPLNSVEKERGDVDIISINRAQGSITIDKTAAIAANNGQTSNNHNHDLKTYTFDYTFSSQEEQLTIFEETAKPIVEAVLKGYNGTIFACQK